MGLSGGRPCSSNLHNTIFDLRSGHSHLTFAPRRTEEKTMVSKQKTGQKK
jgi:hypothetical protein